MSEGEDAAASMADMATAAMDQLLRMLPEGMDPPESLLTLKSAISEAGDGTITEALYAVMIDQTLDYDVTAEGMLAETKADYSNHETDPLVREKVSYIYSYGITMFKRGKIDARVGLDGAGLDKWLAIPSAV